MRCIGDFEAGSTGEAKVSYGLLLYLQLSPGKSGHLCQGFPEQTNKADRRRLEPTKRSECV